MTKSELIELIARKQGATHKHDWEYTLIANLMHLRVETANLK